MSYSPNDSVPRIDDYFSTADEIENWFVECKANSISQKEDKFIADMHSKWETFGMNMFMSEAQYNWLDKIAYR